VVNSGEAFSRGCSPNEQEESEEEFERSASTSECASSFLYSAASASLLRCSPLGSSTAKEHEDGTDEQEDATEEGEGDGVLEPRDSRVLCRANAAAAATSAAVLISELGLDLLSTFSVEEDEEAASATESDDVDEGEDNQEEEEEEEEEETL
jgi:hypothetical protein